MSQIIDTPPTPAERLDCHTAQFEIAWPQPRTAVVTAHGEVDAANVAGFVEYAMLHAADTDRMVIDLSGLTFFATAGFTALHTLNVQCVGEDIHWVLVPSPAVDQLLRICDPDSTLPLRRDVADALSAVHGNPPRLLQLVPETS